MGSTSKYLWVAILFCITSTGCRFLINHLAFFPDRYDIIPAEKLPPGTREIFIPTADGHRLQSYLIQRPGRDRLLIYFHGNAGNIGHRLPDLRLLSQMGVNVLGVGYRGYGKSTGKPSEAGIYSDGRAALAYAAEILGIDPSHIILLGRSIGSTVAVEVGQSRSLAGLILVTPLSSGKAAAWANGYGPLALLAGRAFDNLAKIKNLNSPLLVIHGTADEVIPFEHGRELCAAANPPKTFVPIPGAGHNDISLDPQGAYWQAIRQFMADPPMS